MSSEIKVGVNVIFDRSIYEAIDFASKNKFSSIELWLVAPQFSIENYSKEERVEIASYAKKRNLQILLHAPESISFFETSMEIWQSYFLYLQKVIDFAVDIGCYILTIHPGKTHYFSFPGGKKVSLLERYPKYFLEVFKRNLKRVCEYARNKVFLCMENADNFNAGVRRILQPFLSKKKLFLTWDIAKSYKYGCLDDHEFKFFIKNLSCIKNVHLHDATSSTSHETIKSGIVNFKLFFEKLKGLDVNYIIEVRPHSNAIKSREKLSEIIAI